MILLYISTGKIGAEDCDGNFEFSGETWQMAWYKVDAWMLKYREESRWYKIWA
jgi:hypothetical protein